MMESTLRQSLKRFTVLNNYHFCLSGAVRCTTVSHFQREKSYKHDFRESFHKCKFYYAAILAGMIENIRNTDDDTKIKNNIISIPQPHKASDLLAPKTEDVKSEKDIAGERRPDLKTYTAEEVMKNNTKECLWVTYKHGVYDITEFVNQHPGGDQIMNAAGLSIEPFWNVYGMHKTPEIKQLLEEHRIGNLHENDVMEEVETDIWATEPYRDKRLVVKTPKPFNAEIPPKIQVQHFDTPNELFYVRQHMPVPEVNEEEATFNVIVKTGSGKSMTFTLNDLKKYPEVHVRAALMCAGNRRSEMNEVKPVRGISWTTGAISNAVWSGVYLREILTAAGVDLNDTEGKHIIFTGRDIDATGHNFSSSIPMCQAVDPRSKVLLASRMNGAELPRDHGHPLRVVVPGAPAVRSVKWLESIIISDDEADSHWHREDYRGFNPSVGWDTADFSTAPPMYFLPVTSAICDPVHGECVKVQDGYVEVKGYAYSGGGAAILRVDVTADGGDTWLCAERSAADPAPPGEHYSWHLWELKIPVQKNQKKMEIWVKAVDSNFNTQPETFKHIWNIRGLLSNAYHRINIDLE